jgi:hypothetical protein
MLSRPSSIRSKLDPETNERVQRLAAARRRKNLRRLT